MRTRSVLDRVDVHKMLVTPNTLKEAQDERHRDNTRRTESQTLWR